MNSLLDMMISVLTSKIDHLKSSFKYFTDVLDPNETDYKSETFKEALLKLSETYPNELSDTKYFAAELEVFKDDFSKHVQRNPDTEKTIRIAADFALNGHKNHKLFPHVTKVFKLFLTAPPSVCKSERSFSRMKLLKSYLRSKTKEKKLHYLMILACEKDLTDKLDLQKLADRWKNIKTRRMKI